MLLTHHEPSSGLKRDHVLEKKNNLPDIDTKLTTKQGKRVSKATVLRCYQSLLSNAVKKKTDIFTSYGNCSWSNSATLTLALSWALEMWRSRLNLLPKVKPHVGHLSLFSLIGTNILALVVSEQRIISQFFQHPVSV